MFRSENMYGTDNIQIQQWLVSDQSFITGEMVHVSNISAFYKWAVAHFHSCLLPVSLVELKSRLRRTLQEREIIWNERRISLHLPGAFRVFHFALFTLSGSTRKLFSILLDQNAPLVVCSVYRAKASCNSIVNLIKQRQVTSLKQLRNQ